MAGVARVDPLDEGLERVWLGGAGVGLENPATLA